MKATSGLTSELSFDKDQLIMQLRAEINTNEKRAFEYDRLKRQLEEL